MKDIIVEASSTEAIVFKVADLAARLDWYQILGISEAKYIPWA